MNISEKTRGKIEWEAGKKPPQIQGDWIELVEKNCAGMDREQTDLFVRLLIDPRCQEISAAGRLLAIPGDEESQAAGRSRLVKVLDEILDGGRIGAGTLETKLAKIIYRELDL